MGQEIWLPYCARHLWAVFWELDLERGQGFAGACQLTARDIQAWCWLTQTKLSEWELDAIRAMDAERLNWLRQPKSQKTSMPATHENMRMMIDAMKAPKKQQQQRKK